MNISTICDATSFTSVDTNVVQKSDFIMSFQIGHIEATYLRDQIGMPPEYVFELQKLKVDKNNPPNACALISKEYDEYKPMRVFYPLPSLTKTKGKK